VTKKEIAKAIAEEVGQPQTVVAEVVQRVFDGIIEVLVSEGRIELRNFGVFQIKKRQARKARNPRTGEPVWVPERKVVRFTAVGHGGESSEDESGVRTDLRRRTC